MSQENVDLVLRGIEALNRRDVEGALAPFHEDLEFLDAGTGVSHSGREEMGRWIADFLGSWVEYCETPEQVHDLGDRILLHMRTEACGERSGVAISTHHGEIHGLRDGLVDRLTVYPTYEAALEAAGLTKEEESRNES